MEVPAMLRRIAVLALVAAALLTALFLWPRQPRLVARAQDADPAEMQLPADPTQLGVPERVELFFAGLSALENPPLHGEAMETLANGLVNLGPEAVPTLRKAMHHEKRRIRQLAMMALGWLATEEAVDALIHRVGEREAEEALAEAYIMGDPERRPGTWRERPETAATEEQIFETLVAALDDEDSRVGLTAIRAMGLTRDSAFVEPLIGALQTGGGGKATAAAGALGRILDAAAVEPLIEAAAHPYEGAREEAITALGRIGDPRARDVLIAALDDDDEVVRQAACCALGSLWDGRRVPELVAVLERTTHLGVALAAASAIARLDGARAVEALEKALTDDRDLSFARATVAKSLAALGHTGVDKLVRLLESDEPMVVLYAASGLATVGDLRALEPLMVARTDAAASEIKFGAIAELVARNPEAIAEALLPENADTEARRRAASAARLAFMPDGPVRRPSWEPLMRALKRAAATDPDETMRKHALSALRYVPWYSL